MAHRDRRTSKKTSAAPLTAALRERLRDAPTPAPLAKRGRVRVSDASPARKSKLRPSAASGSAESAHGTADAKTQSPVSSRMPDANDDSFRNMLATELVVVAPLPGALRVPLTAATATARDAARRAVRQKRRQVHFVVERDAYGTTAYRADLGERALEPLQRRWVPQSRIDLHGCSTSQLESALLRAIRAEGSRGIRRLLVIHGKGLHSRDGRGVLAEAVVEILTEGPLASRIRAFCTAPIALGGSGALAVELDLP